MECNIGDGTDGKVARVVTRDGIVIVIGTVTAAHTHVDRNIMGVGADIHTVDLYASRAREALRQCLSGLIEV